MTDPQIHPSSPDDGEPQCHHLTHVWVVCPACDLWYVDLHCCCSDSLALHPPNGCWV